MKCFSNDSIYTQTATSLNDGTYGVVFSTCNAGDTIIVNATGVNKKGQSNGTILSIFQIINVVMNDFFEPVKIEEKKERRDRPSRCGDGKCEGSETLNNCLEDCGSIQISGGVLQEANITELTLNMEVIQQNTPGISTYWIVLGIVFFFLIASIFFVFWLPKNSFK